MFCSSPSRPRGEARDEARVGDGLHPLGAVREGFGVPFVQPSDGVAKLAGGEAFDLLGSAVDIDFHQIELGSFEAADVEQCVVACSSRP